MLFWESHFQYCKSSQDIGFCQGYSFIWVYKDFRFSTKILKNYYCKAAWIKIIVIQEINYSVVKNITCTFLWYLDIIQQDT